MKKFLSILACALVAASIASAQENNGSKRLENNLQLGGGLFIESGGSYADDPGIVMRLSYGLDIRLDEKWSLMPGAGVRIQLADIRHIGWVGGDPDGMSMADLFISGRYHINADGERIIFGLGPALSWMVDRDTYYIDADPSDPLNDKEKFKRYDIGLQPSATFLHGKHFQWGLEANIGLLNALKQYPEYNRTGSVHLNYLALTCGFHF